MIRSNTFGTDAKRQFQASWLRRSPSIAWLLVAILQFWCSSIDGTIAAEPSENLFSNRRQLIESAIQTIPFQRMPDGYSTAVREVLENPSFIRQSQCDSLQCDPNLLNFLVRHPEVMVNIWELIGITNISAERTGANTFSADDGAGTKCNCELIYSENDLHIYYGTGLYDGILVPRTIKGRVVCVLRSNSRPNAQSHSGHLIDGTMDVFLRVDNLGADLLTRTLGPMVGKITDHNYQETSRFVCQLSEVCAKHPQAAQSIAGQLNVHHESVRNEFAAIAAQISLQRRQRISAQNRTDTASPIAGSDSGATLRESLGSVQIATLPDVVPSANLVTASAAQASGKSTGSTAESSRNVNSNATASDTYSTTIRSGASQGVTPKKAGLQLRR
ncbi:MAG TPA: hypothetical protein DCF63_08925 [Planctomycetaceae bacterium]|nr:hypothetical protein [Planctomycetaceae bacterium]